MPTPRKPERDRDDAYEDFKAAMREVANREHPLPATARKRLVRKSSAR